MHVTRIGSSIALAALSHAVLEGRIQSAAANGHPGRMALLGAATTGAILAATLTAPAAAVPVLNERLAATARPQAFQGTSMAEIAASAELALTPPGSPDPPLNSTGPTPEPTPDSGFVLELERPDDGPRFDAYLVSEIKAATELFTEQGVPVISVTSPVVSLMKGRGSGLETANTSDDPARIRRLNELVTQTTSTNRLAGLVDLYAWFNARPAGPLDPTLRPDGIHATLESSGEVAQWLGPMLLAEYAVLSGADG